MAHSIPQAKNYIRKTLWRLVDKEPSAREIIALWLHFDSKCAYCGKHLTKEGRNGHIDHLEANRAIGRNHVSNRVLACNICNGDEKRESGWREFLARKCGPDENAYHTRHTRIIAWCDQHGTPPIMDAAIIAEVHHGIERCNRVLDDESKRIRALLASAETKNSQR